MIPTIAIGARVRKSPYFDKTIEEGVSSFSVYNHMYMPTGYGDPAAEYDRLINGVAMWDVGVERQVLIKGDDAQELVRYLTTRDLKEINIGQGRYVPLCDHRGTLINDPVLLTISEDEFWLSIADSDITLWARGIAAERGLRAAIYEPDVSPLAIQGPKAIDVVSNLFGDWVRELKYFGHREAVLNGIPLQVARSGWSKQGGYELYLQDGSRGGELWDLVKEAGQPYDIGPGSPNYIERLESGLLSYGADTDDNTNPFEVGLGKFVHLEREDDFIGKESLQRIKDNGIFREFVGYKIEGFPLEAGNQHRWPVKDGESYIGFVSASAWSPRVNSNIGVGLIEARYSEPGTQVQIVTGNSDLNAEVSKLPFTMPA
ncbi:MAG: glycine cleavage T C-terminal barrel domain-containing protein [Pseudomonadota bacterium]